MFVEVINESYDIEYHEDGELDEPVMKIIDKDDDKEHQFYPEDIKIIKQFLNRLEGFGIRFDDK